MLKNGSENGSSNAQKLFLQISDDHIVKAKH